MAQGTGSPAFGREVDHLGQEEHRCQQEKGFVHLLRMSPSLSPCSLVHIHFPQTSSNNSQEPHSLIPKLFGPLRERFLNRPGGYTRVLRIEPIKEDQAPSAILELVDGPKDMRFAMTARTVSRLRREGKPINDMTAGNIAKVTRFRPDGDKHLEDMVAKFDKLEEQGETGFDKIYKQRVYHNPKASR
jgi:hypothetical protein